VAHQEHAIAAVDDHALRAEREPSPQSPERTWHSGQAPKRREATPERVVATQQMVSFCKKDFEINQ